MSADELLDLLDPSGAPLTGPDGKGLTKRRADVHRDGDWHGAFHLWVVSAGHVLLQRRAADKDAWPEMLDATAAGHLTAGEQPIDGLREAEEELGVRYEAAELKRVGTFSLEDSLSEDVTNREFQHVYLVCDERPLGAFTEIDRREMIELVAVPISGFSVLIGGGESAGISWDGIRERAVVVSGAELVPAPYLGELAEAMLLAGRA